MRYGLSECGGSVCRVCGQNRVHLPHLLPPFTTLIALMRQAVLHGCICGVHRSFVRGGGYNWLTIRIQTNKESQLKYHKTWHLYSHNLFEYLTFLSQICTESEWVYIKRSNTEPEWYHWKTVREYLPHTHLCLILILHQSTHVSENITTHIHVTCWHGKETEICMVCWIDMSIMQVLIMLPLCFLTI